MAPAFAPWTPDFTAVPAVFAASLCEVYTQNATPPNAAAPRPAYSAVFDLGAGLGGGGGGGGSVEYLRTLERTADRLRAAGAGAAARRRDARRAAKDIVFRLEVVGEDRERCGPARGCDSGRFMDGQARAHTLTPHHVALVSGNVGPVVSDG